MSSSFPTARFPALPLGKEKEGADPVYKDTAGASEELTDQTLIARICENDDEALNLLFKRYSRLVWNIARRILGDSAEAEDVMQEVFLLIHSKAAAFDPAKGPPRTLIVHMTYQSACKRRRYLNGRHAHYSWQLNESVATPPAVSVCFFDESIEAHFGKEGLRNAIAELSQAQRRTLRLYFFDIRTGYACGWIEIKNGVLELIPHPDSGVPTRTFRYPGEVDVVGRVTGVAMRITGEEFAPIDARGRRSTAKK